MGHAWIKTYYVLCTVQKHEAALAMYHNPPLVRDKPLGASTSVKLVYCKDGEGPARARFTNMD